jgi:hypothetical protein
MYFLKRISSPVFHLLLSNYSGLQAFIDGKQTKQTTQVLTATNVRQTPNGWVCPNLQSPPGMYFY